MNRALSAARHAFVRGILLLLPLAITYLILRWIFVTITSLGHGPLTRVIAALGERAQVGPLSPAILTLLGLVLTVALVLLVGIVGGNYVGRLLWGYFDRIVLRLPFIRWFYGSARQLIDAFGMTGKEVFREVVLVEFPRRGIWTLGFVTGAMGSGAPDGSGEDFVYVYLPTTPVPTSGYTIIIARSEAKPTTMTVDEGLKVIVSGGFIAPRPEQPAPAPGARR